MKSILSTKILTADQKEPLLGLDSGGLEKFIVKEYDAIKIEPVKFSMPKKLENAIFTSKNTIMQIQNSEPAFRVGRLGIKNCFCVGRKTKELLEKKGLNVVAFADYGKDLAEIIVEKYAHKKFTFFCGNRRREELPSILKANNVEFEELQVYKTQLNPQKFQQDFTAILFFSPSGVESFCMENELKISTAFCIGKTTATEAKKYTNKIVVAEKPTVESLTYKVFKTL